jgi:Cdc6-like AAA superfamily ATPase
MIAGINRAEFERILPTVLTPTTPIRSVEFLRGREKILEDIRRSFVQPGRHVFIHGDRGVGKTSLAQTAAIEHQSSSAAPIFIGCDNASTFYSIARNVALKLRPTDPSITKTTRGGKISAGWKSVLSAEAQQIIERGAIPDFRTIDDVIGAIGYLAEHHSQAPVIVIDEFERITAASERMLFADFIKQVGDQSLPVKLIFCGIGSALGDLLDAHHSCYRYLTAIALDRLGYQPRLEIMEHAVSALGLKMEDTSAYRIAMISDGFPHYVHLITEKLLWEAFQDGDRVITTKPHHYTKAIGAAVIDIEPHLKAMYEKASLKYKSDYETVLWAVADHHELKRRSTDIYNSYSRIMRSLGEDPLSRETFNQRMNSLKRATHASILKANRQGWYEFSEAVVRGYVRLRAEARGVQLGNEHPLDARNPAALANVPRQTFSVHGNNALLRGPAPTIRSVPVRVPVRRVSHSFRDSSRARRRAESGPSFGPRRRPISF